ncbi:MAG: hypothetical protein RL148_6 [Planctomycetota bacterium]
MGRGWYKVAPSLAPSRMPDAANPTQELVSARTAVPRWALFLCLLVAAAVHLPAALQAQFLNFDDNFFFGPDNPAFRDGDLWGILDPSRTIANAYLPVAHLSLYLDFVLGDGRPMLPHLVSVLFHGLAAWALWRWLAALGLRPVLAGTAAVLALAHPALVESVAWVSSRKDVLSGLFTFLALEQCARAASDGRARRHTVLAVLFAVLALYSKPTAVVLPLLAGLGALHQGKAGRGRFLPVLLLGLVTVAVALHHRHLAAVEGTLAPTAAGPGQAAGALWHYATTLVWPVQLNVLYPEELTREAFRADASVAALALGALLVGALVAWRVPRLRDIGLGVLVALVALLPFNTVYPASAIAAADRYLYLVVPGAALALAAAVGALVRTPLVALAALVPLALLARERVEDFRDSEALWRSSLAVEPRNAVAWLNLASAFERSKPGRLELLRDPLQRAAAEARIPVHAWRAERALLELAVREGRTADAAGHARRTVAAAEQQYAQEAGELRRKQALANLLDALLVAHQPLVDAGEDPAAVLARARELAPEHPAVVAFGATAAVPAVERELLARAAGGGRTALPRDDARAVDAMGRLGAALAAAPDDPDLNHAAGLWEQLCGQSMAALKHFRRSIAARPDAPRSYLGAASVCRQQGLYDQAEEYARAGLARTADPQLRYELGLALAGRGRLDDAIQHLSAYAQVRPDDRAAARSLANFLAGKAIASMSDPTTSAEELERLVTESLRWNPAEVRVELVRGKVARDRRQFQQSVVHLEKFLAVVPDFDEARSMLAESCRDLGYERMFAGDEDGCLAAWRRFLEVAPSDIETEAVRLQLQNLWRKAEAAGVDALRAGDRAGAIRSFRRCLSIDATQHWAAWLLATALFEQPDADLAEVERLLQQAIAGQASHGLDRSRQVLLRVLTLRRLQREDEARAAAAAYVAAPDAEADPQALEMLRVAAQG